MLHTYLHNDIILWYFHNSVDVKLCNSLTLKLFFTFPNVLTLNKDWFGMIWLDLLRKHTLCRTNYQENIPFMGHLFKNTYLLGCHLWRSINFLEQFKKSLPFIVGADYAAIFYPKISLTPKMTNTQLNVTNVIRQIHEPIQSIKDILWQEYLSVPAWKRDNEWQTHSKIGVNAVT